MFKDKYLIMIIIGFAVTGFLFSLVGSIIAVSNHGISLFSILFRIISSVLIMSLVGFGFHYALKKFAPEAFEFMFDPEKITSKFKPKENKNEIEVEKINTPKKHNFVANIDVPSLDDLDNFDFEPDSINDIEMDKSIGDLDDIDGDFDIDEHSYSKTKGSDSSESYNAGSTSMSVFEKKNDDKLGSPEVMAQAIRTEMSKDNID